MSKFSAELPVFLKIISVIMLALVAPVVTVEMVLAVVPDAYFIDG